jgi:NAD(P)H-hydrate epimerase
VRADATVVLGAAKRGLLTPAAVPYTGRLVFADIGIVAGPGQAPEIIDLASLRGLLPQRAPDAHKFSFGRLLVVAGSQRYLGAAYLTCAAAVRAGAGLVTLAAPYWLRDVVAARLAEITYLPLPDAGIAGAPEEAATRILAELSGYGALALGPGLSMEGGVGACVEAILRGRALLPLPAVVDADGLNALAQQPSWPSWIGEGIVMTPHAGELQRLTKTDYRHDQTVWERARSLAEEWRVALVLKGPFTAIGAEGWSWVHAGPNPALATAGTGDVLTGIIAGLLAQGMTPADAARLGVWVHSRAGAAAAEGRGAGGLMASELLDEVPRALALTGASRPPEHYQT